MPTPEHMIRNNGSVEISAGGINIKGIIPSIDEVPVLPFFVNSDDSSARFETTEGCVVCSYRTDGDELIISTSVKGYAGVHDIEPIGAAVISGADHVYAQGFGMEGPSGFYPIDHMIRHSHGIIGLSGQCASDDNGADEKCPSVAVIFAVDHSRYSTKFSVSKREAIFAERYQLTVGFDLEGTLSGADDEFFSLPEIHIICGNDMQECMSRAARRIADEMGARTCMKPAFHWCSWYYHYENMNQRALEEMLCGIDADETGKGSRVKSAASDFNYIQLDAGYTAHIGDWLTYNHRYPGGLEKAAKTIIDAGFEAGIWIAPFMVGDESEVYREHPDWVIHEPDGKPYVRFRSYTEPKIWGNTDNDYYVIDATHPGAYAYLKEVFSTLRRWGFTLYKTDFMLWGMVDSSKAVRYDNTKTSVMVIRDTLAMIRDAIGDESYLLGSIAPFMPCIGFMDGMRIASDMGAQWTDGAFGPYNLLQELPYDNYFNNIFWQNDPDSVILRDFATHLTEDETWSIALLQALSGGIITTSDPVHKLPEDRLRLLEFIKPADRMNAEMPLICEGSETIVITHHLHDWDLLYVLNPTSHPVSVNLRLDEMFGTKALFQYRFNRNDDERINSENRSCFSEILAPHDSALLFVTEDPMTVKPSNLWFRTTS